LFLELKFHNFCIISGGMYGVDIYAHNLALRHGLKTIVVIPQGINLYLKSYLFKSLKIQNLSNILIASKYPDSFSARKYSFIERNKVIVDLSEAVLIVQASEKSGTLSTANYALKLSKSTFSVPTSLENKQFQGTNLIINRGANIYLNPLSILNHFGISTFNLEELIVSKLKISPINFNELINLLDTEHDLLQKSLLKLILEGKIFFDGEYYFL